MQYLLYYAIGTTKTSFTAPIIPAAHCANAGNARMHDVYGLTPVYIALASKNAHALCAFLSLDLQVTIEDLEDRKNQDSIIALEGLESSMRSMRVYRDIGGWVEGLLDIC